MDAIVRFYHEYSDLRTKYGFKADFTYNLDETMINISTRRKKVIVFNDQPSLLYLRVGN